MPSPFVHVSYALGFGTLIMASTKGSFTPVHCLLLALNGFFGPDIGSFISWCLSKASPIIADKAMTWIHHSFGYTLIVAPVMAILSSSLTRKLISWKYRSLLHIDSYNTNKEQTNKSISPLNLKGCYFLAVAGCLLHFQLDHIFEENGQDNFYRWILSTGYFEKPTPPLSPLSIIYVGSCTLVLSLGFTWIHVISSSISQQSLTVKLKYTVILFLIVFSLYLSFLIITTIILKEEAVIGEEADLGVIVFIVIFHFLPFVLCLLSASN